MADIEQPVVAAASMTPFEAGRRVFVIESAETMNDQAANRLLKTLEEPPSFVHLILLSDRLADVMPTIVSRCQQVRFDPAPAELIESRLEGVPPDRARACARLALGDAALARRLAGEEGERLRAAAEGFARGALAGETEGRPWSALLEAARASGTLAGERAAERIEAELELIPAKERKRHEREGLEARRRGERRARTGTLDLGLRLAELWLRDVLCLVQGAPELIFAVDRRAELEQDAAEADAPRLHRGDRAGRRGSPEPRPERLRGAGAGVAGLRHPVARSASGRSGDRPEVRLEPERVEGHEAVELAVFGSVEVGGAGGEHAELAGALGEQPGLLARRG